MPNGLVLQHLSEAEVRYRHRMNFLDTGRNVKCNHNYTFTVKNAVMEFLKFDGTGTNIHISVNLFPYFSI